MSLLRKALGAQFVRNFAIARSYKKTFWKRMYLYDSYRILFSVYCMKFKLTQVWLKNDSRMTQEWLFLLYSVSLSITVRLSSNVLFFSFINDCTRCTLPIPYRLVFVQHVSSIKLLYFCVVHSFVILYCRVLTSLYSIKFHVTLVTHFRPLSSIKQTGASTRESLTVKWVQHMHELMWTLIFL